MAYFKLNDKHIAFCNAIAGGTTHRSAYIEHMAVSDKCTLRSAAVTASRLLSRPEIKACIERCRLAREQAITGIISRNVAKEFETIVLTVTELDSFHSSVVQGMVEVEEVVPVYKWTERLNEEGKVIGRSKEANFMKIKRPPNVREKQISVDALYKRFGHYAPSRFFGALKNMNDEPEDNVQRVLILSTGERIALP